MNSITVRMAAAGLAAACLSGLAFGQANLNRMVTFGDSLTHNDILGLVYGNPRDLYGDDPNEAVWKKGAQSGDRLTSYAVAGSESSQVLLQIDTFIFFEFLGIEDPPTIVGFEIGGNDILNNIGTLKQNPPGIDPAADAVINRLTNNIRTALTTLYTEYRCQFIVWNIPDVTLTPAEWNLTSAERENVRAHIQVVNRRLAQGATRGPIALADIYTGTQDFVTDPPVIYGQALIGPPAFGQYDYLYADDIHPTAVSNLVIANGIIETVNLQFNDDIPLYTEDELAAAAKLN